MPEDKNPLPDPAAPEADDAGPKPKKRRDWLVGCASTFLCLAALLLIIGGCWSREVGKLNREFSAHVRGLIDAEAAERPVVPTEENAAPLYTAAFALYGNPKPSDLFRNINEPVIHSRPPTSSTLWSPTGPCLEALRKATARPKCDFRPDLSEGFGLKLPHVIGFREALFLIALAARQEAQSGRPAEALELLALGLRISRDAGSDEITISRMVQVACEGLFVSALQNVMNESAPDAAAVEKLLAELERCIKERRGMAPVMRREKLVVLATIDAVVAGKVSFGELSDGGEDSTTAKAAAAFWRFSGALTKAGYDIEKLMDEYVAAAGKPCPRAMREAEEITARMVAEEGKTKGPSRILKGLLLGSYSRFLDGDARSLARLSAARLALGCKLHKLKTGQWPQSLADLPKAFPERFKELPSDPFTGKPFIYKLTDKGCLVYSVGPDGKDDGGTAYDAKTRWTNFDLPFELKK